MKKIVMRLGLVLCVLVMMTALIITPKAAVTCQHEYVDTVCTKCGKIGGMCGAKLVWTFIPESNLLRISGSGNMNNYTADFPAPWTPYRSLIQEVVLGEGTTSLGTNAFAECYNLKTINIPYSMSNIHTSSFLKCDRLEEFVVDEDANYSLDEKGVLYNLKKTYLIALPGVFQGECFIPDTVTNVGPSAEENPFRFIKGVTKITVDENNTMFSSTEDGLLFDKEQTQLVVVPRAYAGDCTLPATMTSYAAGAFTDCYGLTGIHVEEENTQYSAAASGLLCSADGTEVTLCPAGFTGTCIIPVEVTSCPISAFSQSVGLTKFQVEDGNAVYSSDEAGMLLNKEGTKLLICPNAYTGIYKLPEGVTTIASNAFQYCPGMTGFEVASDSDRYSVDEYGALYNKDKTALIACPGSFQGSYKVLDTVTTLGNYAFYKCSGLTEVILPDTLTTIGDYCFYQCENLGNVPLPAGLKKLGSHAFAHCPNQTDADIPATVTSIGTYAFACCDSIVSATVPEGITSVTGIFYMCPNLESVSLPGTLQTLGRDCFYECFALQQINVPDTLISFGDNCFWKCEKLPNITLPSNLVNIGSWAFACCYNQTDAMIPESVTNVGTHAFAYCDSLEEASIPEGITFIEATFRNCGNLKIVTLPSTLQTLGGNTFYNCEKLEQVNVPDGVTRIGGNCFRNCQQLPNVPLPSGLTMLSDAAFYECPNQTDAMIPETVTVLGQSVFGYCENLKTASIPEGITVVPEGMFQFCTNLESVTIPQSVTQIDYAAFNNCVNLRKADIPAGVTIIGKSAFNRCTNLENLYVPAGVTEIGSSAFAYCDKLTEVMIPEAVTRIEMDTFYECGNLVNVKLHNGITYIGNRAFYDCKKMKPFALPNQLEEIGKYAFRYCDQFKEVMIPESVKKIDECAFRYCMNLRKVVIPGTVDEIVGYTFYGCPMLADVTLGEGLTQISDYMFYDCIALETVEIPNSVTRIGVKAFQFCEVLREVSMPAQLTEIAMNAFEGCHALEHIQLPVGLTNLGEQVFLDSGLNELVIPQSVTELSDRLLAQCKNLETVTIPASVTTIQDAVFINAALTDVIYHGSETQWQNISIGTANNALKNAQMHYDPGETYAHQITLNTVEPSCETDGGIYRCCDCGVQQKLENIEATGHNYTWDVTKQPTCTQLGVRTYTCTKDPSHTYTQKVSATGHKSVPMPAEVATCDKPGLTAGKRCENCQVVLVPQLEIPALGHEWNEGATCTTPKICTVCHKVITEAGHIYSHEFDNICDLCGEERTVDMSRPMADMFRMYDPNSGEHFYTGSVEERDNLVAVGWKYEGIGFTFPLATGNPVHRLYDPVTGEHLYTMDTEEVNKLLAQGWNYEGIAFNSGFENEVPQYRLHNPNATRGAYHFTASEEEKNNLIAAGWEYQGIGWYSLGG